MEFMPSREVKGDASFYIFKSLFIQNIEVGPGALVLKFHTAVRWLSHIQMHMHMDSQSAKYIVQHENVTADDHDHWSLASNLSPFYDIFNEYFEAFYVSFFFFFSLEMYSNVFNFNNTQVEYKYGQIPYLSIQQSTTSFHCCTLLHTLQYIDTCNLLGSNYLVEQWEVLDGAPALCDNMSLDDVPF